MPTTTTSGYETEQLNHEYRMNEDPGTQFFPQNVRTIEEDSYLPLRPEHEDKEMRGPRKFFQKLRNMGFFRKLDFVKFNTHTYDQKFI